MMKIKLVKPLTATQLRKPLLAQYRVHEKSGMLPTSGRFLFYELEQQGYISKYQDSRTDGKKGRRPDQNMIDALTALREEGLIPWEAIIDETRAFESYAGTRLSPLDYCHAVLEQQYKIDLWNGPIPLILTESRSLAGVLRPVAQTYRANITSTNGQANGFLRNEILPEIEDDTVVLYFGDYDFSGGHIEENSRKLLGYPPRWERLAVTKEQIEKFRLSVIQKFDKRDQKTHEAVETEALSQEVIVRILTERLEALLPEPLASVHVRERASSRRAQAAIRTLDGEE
jgi:hypothetical protein